MSILVVDVSLVLPGSDDAGETEDEDTATDDGQTEVVEHHGPSLHQVAHHHREEFGPQGAADDQRGAHQPRHADLLLRPEEPRGEDGGHPDPQHGGADIEDQGGLVCPD